ncbi:hypothetical protein C6Y40_19625 [Alteromonas alba]|uniref:Uncharacterized protein n=1 Tax=Alteromonas alba TaxID=2079529 RepID=A0A2S9V647_9ALTE|nr:hypothetical protein C6Y40_19625 [Alteromonas alba]
MNKRRLSTDNLASNKLLLRVHTNTRFLRKTISGFSGKGILSVLYTHGVALHRASKGINRQTADGQAFTTGFLHLVKSKLLLIMGNRMVWAFEVYSLLKTIVLSLWDQALEVSHLQYF